MKGTHIALLVSTFLIQMTGCITTEESYEETRDLTFQQEIERELKTEEDWERWHKQKKHNKNATVILQ